MEPAPLLEPGAPGKGYFDRQRVLDQWILLPETKLSNRGIGYLIIQAYATFDMPRMYALLIVLFVSFFSVLVISNVVTALTTFYLAMSAGGALGGDRSRGNQVGNGFGLLKAKAVVLAGVEDGRMAKHDQARARPHFEMA